MLIIYIAEKFPLLFRPKTKFWLKKYANFFSGEEDRMTSVDLGAAVARPPQ